MTRQTNHAKTSIAVIALYGIVLLVALAASGKSLNYHEARYAQAVREMVASGNWLIPTVGGDPRLQKPAFTYWVIAVFFRIFGASGFSARLPTAIAALASALVIARLVASRLSERLGLAAGLAQLSSVYTLVSGQLADPDMLLGLAVVTAIACSAGVLLAPPGEAPSRSLLLGFYAALGISFLVKGPIGAAFILPPSALLAVAERGRDAWRPFADPLGLGVLVALCAIWPLAAYLSNGAVLDAWLEENVGRMRGDLGREPALYYVYTVPWMLLPWAPLTAIGAYAIWRERARDPIWLLFAAWFASGVFLLSLSAGKHARYLVPVLPALSAFTAVGFREIEPAIARRIDPARAAAAALAVFLVGAIIVQWVAVDRFDGYRQNRELAERANREVPEHTRIALFGIPHNERVQLLFYLDETPVVVEKPEELANGGAPRYVIAPANAAEALGKAMPISIVDEATKALRHHEHQERLVLFRVA